MNKKILLVNLGSPKSLSTDDVREYLREFLSDDKVIDLPKVIQQFILRAFILPFRPAKAKKAYEKIWQKEGSPLIINTQKIANSLSKKTGWSVDIAMRYQHPSIADKIKLYKKESIEQVTIIPLYPHSAMSTTQTTIEEINRIASEVYPEMDVNFVKPFYDDSNYINALANSIRPHVKNLDKIVFSYHGIPERHVDKVYLDGKPCADHSCEDEINSLNANCYKATCYATTRLLVKALKLKEGSYSTCFQSRLGRDPWLQPYTDHTIEKLGKEGKKRVLVFSPAFVADCLETTIEIGEEYLELFQEHGGKEIQLVPSLNDNDDWAEGLYKIIKDKL